MVKVLWLDASALVKLVVDEGDPGVVRVRQAVEAEGVVRRTSSLCVGEALGALKAKHLRWRKWQLGKHPEPPDGQSLDPDRYMASCHQLLSWVRDFVRVREPKLDVLSRVFGALDLVQTAGTDERERSDPAPRGSPGANQPIGGWIDFVDALQLLEFATASDFHGSLFVTADQDLAHFARHEYSEQKIWYCVREEIPAFLLEADSTDSSDLPRAPTS